MRKRKAQAPSYVRVDKNLFEKLAAMEEFWNTIPIEFLPRRSDSFGEWYERYVRPAQAGSEANLAPPPPITTQRQPIYGHPALNFSRQAIMWSGLLANKLVKPITPQEVALMMTACKIARLVETPTHEDSITDVGGYMSCLEQVNAVMEAGSDGTGIRSETVAQARATATDPT